MSVFGTEFYIFDIEVNSNKLSISSSGSVVHDVVLYFTRCE